MQKKVVLIGISGSGKSTLLNGLVGKLVFKSGVSLGTGLTKEMKPFFHQSDEIIYIDTVGFDDETNQKQAVVELQKVFKAGGSFKVFFVCIEESGRILKTHAEYLKKFLDSIDEDFGYACIVNKVSRRVQEHLKNAQSMKDFQSTLETGLEKTPESFYIYPLISEIYDEDNKLHSPSVEYVDWVKKQKFYPIRSEKVKMMEMEAEKRRKLEEENRRIEKEKERVRKQQEAERVRVAAEQRRQNELRAAQWRASQNDGDDCTIL